MNTFGGHPDGIGIQPVIDLAEDARSRLVDLTEAGQQLLETAFGGLFLEDFAEAQDLAERVAQVVSNPAQAAAPDGFVRGGIRLACRRWIGIGFHQGKRKFGAKLEGQSSKLKGQSSKLKANIKV